MTGSPPGPRSAAPWPRRGGRSGPDLLLFRARFDLMESPRTGERLERVVLETPPWCNVIALTEERRFVMVRQYRFGRAAVTTEIPGGVVDRGEPPRVTAERELLEETGYQAARWEYLGASEPNPAFHDNLCHHWLAAEARPGAPRRLDRGEDIEVLELSAAEVRAAVASGAIRHALVLAALCRVLDLRRLDPFPPPGR